MSARIFDDVDGDDYDPPFDPPPTSSITRVECPVHKMPDCSPLLNGCGIPGNIARLLDSASADAWDEGYLWHGRDCIRVGNPTPNPYREAAE